MALGRAAELIRLREIREALADLEREDGVYADASVWIMGATAP